MSPILTEQDHPFVNILVGNAAYLLPIWPFFSRLLNPEIQNPGGKDFDFEGGRISAGIQSAIAKLKHKDIRHRRRAIRVLFEANDPNNLHAFEAMLNDKDPWFRGKALEAYRNWAPYQEASSLDPLIDSMRVEANRTASTILEKMNTDCTKQAMKLIECDDTSAVNSHLCTLQEKELVN